MNELWHAFSLRAVRGSLVWNFLLTLMALAIGYSVMHFGLERRLTDFVAKDLRENLQFISRPLASMNTSQVVTWCKEIPRNNGKRFSIIAADGTVLCDNYADVENLVNHSDRPEFKAAMDGGAGSSTRPSTTTETTMVYASLRIQNENVQPPLVLRIAMPQMDLKYHLDKMRSLVIKNLAAVLFVLVIIFIWASMRVALPLRSLEKKLGSFKILANNNDIIVPETRNEWEKVDFTVDHIYRDLNSKIDEIDRSNDKISTIIESIADGLLAIESNEKILFTNAQLADVFEYSPDKNLNGKPLLDVIRDVDIRQAFKSVLTTKKPFGQKVKIGNRKFDLRVYPLMAKAQQVTGAVGVFHDITQSMLLQQMREDFVANVSHEVRTPLTAIKGYAQILTSLTPQDVEAYNSYATKIEHNVNRLADLFQDILSLSVLESSEKVNKEYVDANDIIQTTISNIKQSHPEKKLQITKDLSIDKLWVEPRLFEQVLTNLLDNAHKYTLENGTISIKAYHQDGFDIIEVSDTGVGIPKESLARVFERFYRVDASRAREVGGTGLGLAIVKHAVQKHSGTVTVQSVVGEGTCFSVKIPAKPLA